MTPWRVLIVLIICGLAALNFVKYQEALKNGRPLDSPSKRLIGHWQLYSRSELPSYEFFFSPTEGDLRSGNVAMLDNFEDHFLLRGEYRVLGETVSGTRLVIRQDLGNQAVRQVTILVSKDGSSALYWYYSGEEEFKQRMIYVDDRTTPPSLQELRDGS